MEASDLRNDLAQELTPRQLEEGQALSTRWQPHSPLPTHSSTGN